MLPGPKRSDEDDDAEGITGLLDWLFISGRRACLWINHLILRVKRSILHASIFFGLLRLSKG